MLVFADESSLARVGAYVIAAVRVPPEHADEARSQLLALRPGKAPRLHWRADSHQVRLRTVEALAGRGFQAHAYVVRVAAPRRQERARADALHQLLYGLRDVPDCRLLLDRRTPAQDETDRKVIGAAKRGQVAAGDLAFSHVRSIDEPLLWLPDLVAGAVAAQLLGDPQYVELLPRLRVLEP